MDLVLACFVSGLNWTTRLAFCPFLRLPLCLMALGGVGVDPTAVVVAATVEVTVVVGVSAGVGGLGACRFVLGLETESWRLNSDGASSSLLELVNVVLVGVLGDAAAGGGVVCWISFALRDFRISSSAALFLTA